VGDMSSQHRRIREESEAASRPSPAAAAELRRNGIGLVAVVSGQGLVNIFRSLGVDAIVAGGPTMNPSTQDMLEAVERVPYHEVLLLPNNKNVMMAAKQVDGVSAKAVKVLETHTVPQGIAAVVAFRPDLPAGENLTAMSAAARHIQTIEVTHAVRDSRSNGVTVKKGDVIALINERLRHAGKEYVVVVQEALDGIGAGDYELITIYCGQQVTEAEATRLTEAIRGNFPTLEIEVQSGGQEHYPFILSVE